MNKFRKFQFFFILNCCGYAVMLVPFFIFFPYAMGFGEQLNSGAFLDYVSYIVAGIIVGVPWIKYTKSQLDILNAEMDRENKFKLFRKIALLVPTVFVMITYYKVSLIRNEYRLKSTDEKKYVKKVINEQIPLPLEPVFQEHALAFDINAQNKWGTCTFLLFKDDGKSGGTKIEDTVVKCVTKFKDYFKKYACIGASENGPSIKSGQLNFGKKFNYERKPASGYFVLVTAKCVSK